MKPRLAFLSLLILGGCAAPPQPAQLIYPLAPPAIGASNMPPIIKPITK